MGKYYRSDSHFYTNNCDPYHIRLLEDVPALYAVFWSTPRVIAQALRGDFVYTLKEGAISEIWPLMVQDQHIKVKYNTNCKVNFF